ncbi:MAG TPA: hypothetical protein DCS63_03175 [Elusimicrobia bacterium]|nr:hypothetical protein [Elusimicrobiota bacterium]
MPALLALACCAAYGPAAARAQAGTPLKEQSFDYTPEEEEQTPAIQQSIAETTYEDAEIINHPLYGTIILSRYRWKSWVARALYLALINIALIAIIISLSKTEEYNIVISYILTGASLTVSFWCFLCAVLLFQLKSYSWTYISAVSASTAALGFVVLARTKKYDVSLTEIKESFKRMRATSREDQRLSSVDGSPGDWPDQDFTR